ncbi:hypothetical protein [Paenibacillus sp. DMB20]|uniref:hypothetical protein n=1 Tax=Paenibacillus sp. DMB20 TaxID=1642570 RepID=UPI000ACC3E5D|nr:hypothetical protein [Paenibacillus sp. DMB20]
MQIEHYPARHDGELELGHAMILNPDWVAMVQSVAEWKKVARNFFIGYIVITIRHQ